MRSFDSTFDQQVRRTARFIRFVMDHYVPVFLGLLAVVIFAAMYAVLNIVLPWHAALGLAFVLAVVASMVAFFGMMRRSIEENDPF